MLVSREVEVEDLLIWVLFKRVGSADAKNDVIRTNPNSNAIFRFPTVMSGNGLILKHDSNFRRRADARERSGKLADVT